MSAQQFVTHVNPHLDDICGIWLYRTFVPGWREATYTFIKKLADKRNSLNEMDPDSDPSIVHIGTGMGMFDEHKGDMDDTSATLVYKFLEKQGLLPKEGKAGLDVLLAHVKQVDMGYHAKNEFPEFYLPGLLRALNDSQAATEMGCRMLDAAWNICVEKLEAEEAWKQHTEFQTKWGKGATMETAGSRGSGIAYDNGFVMVLTRNKLTGWTALLAQPESQVDLTAAYEAFKQADPDATWFLHHAKKMVLCGSPTAPEAKITKLSLAEMEKLVEQSS